MHDHDKMTSRAMFSRRLLSGALAVGSVSLFSSQNAHAARSNVGPLEDRAAIERLLYRYAIAIDYLDVKTYKSCFAAGATMEGKAGKTRVKFEGPQLAETVIEYHRTRTEATMHQVLDHVYTVKGSQATGLTYGVATWITKGKTDELTKYDQYMRYYDDVVKEEGSWVFRMRRMEVLFTTRVPVESFFAEPRSGEVPPM